MAATNRQPFTLSIVGTAEMPHHAERAKLNVTVSSTGPNKASVSDEAITTTQHIESLLKPHCPPDPSPEAKRSAAVAHWSKTSLSTSSFTPHRPNETTPAAAQHTATVRLDIRFKTGAAHAPALGAFVVKLSALPHVRIESIEWLLTAGTEKGFRSELRRAAASDALARARDYCHVLACADPRPVQLDEGTAHWAGGNAGSGMAGQNNASFQQMQSAQPANSGVRRGPPAVRAGEEGWDFRAQVLRMSMEVTVKFQAEWLTTVEGGKVGGKRARSDDEEMVDR